MKKNNKKPNVVLYTILMFIVFVILTDLVIWGYAGDFITESILSAPQGEFVVGEAVLASLVLIVMLAFGNSYVFSQKNEKVYKGLFYGSFYLIGALIIGLFFIVSNKITSVSALLNIFIGCFLVGVAEEFLCRGWLLNEFLERFGDNKKGVIYSIIISGTIFGLMHFGNILVGQDIITTSAQVINALGIGLVLGVIYYKTKNIWSVIILHAVWDFALFLGKISPVTEGTETFTSMNVLGIVFPLLMAGSQLISIYPLIKDFDDKPKNGKVILFSSLGFVFYFVFLMISAFSITSFGDTFKYDSINLENYSITSDNYTNYNMNYKSSYGEDYSFELTMNEKDELVLINKNTNYSISLDYTKLYDYIILEQEEYFVLGYIDYDNVNTLLRYIYINKNEISNDKSFLDNIKKNIKRYLLSERSELVVINDRENNKSYIAAYENDYGYYLLVEEEKMAILNRD